MFISLNFSLLIRLISLSPSLFYRKRDLGSDKVICPKSSIKWGEAEFKLGQSNSKALAFNYCATLTLQKRNKNFIYIMIIFILFLKSIFN